MSGRIHAARVITKRRLSETLISPGFYIAQAVGLLVGYFLVTGFVKAIDSSGFNFQLYPVYDLISRSLQGAFGSAFVDKLFSEGPFLFTLYVSFFPVFLYLAISSVFKFGLEKKVGALELLAYGPADGTSYFMAFLIKDILLTALYLLILTIFLGITAALNNLILGPMFYYSLVSIFFISSAIYAYGILASALTENSASAIALFIGVLLFFLIVIMGSFTIVSGYVRNLTSVFAWIIKWLSPFFYWDLGLRAIETGNSISFLLSLLFLIILSWVILFVSHITLKVKGVRA